MNSNPSRRITRRAAVATGIGAAGTATVSASWMRDVLAQDATPVAATPMASPVVDDVRVRRNARDLSADEKRAFTDAVLTLKEKPSPWDSSVNAYDQFVLWHRDAFHCDLMAAHMGPAFFPWHRQFLLLFEDQLREVDPSVTLPYWDWTVDDATDSYLWQDDFMGGTGVAAEDYAVMDGPFRKGAFEISVFDEADEYRVPFLVLDLGVGELAPDLPTAEQVEEALSIEHYDAAPWNEMADPQDSFRNYLEGWRDCVPQDCFADPTEHPDCPGDHLMHNRVHLWVSGEFIFAHQGAHQDAPEPLGTMAANSSPNDPVFFLHHANCDRLWNEWMKRHGKAYEPESGAMHGHNLHDHMWPYSDIGMTVTPAMMLDSRSIGVIYDTDES